MVWIFPWEGGTTVKTYVFLLFVSIGSLVAVSADQLNQAADVCFRMVTGGEWWDRHCTQAVDHHYICSKPVSSYIDVAIVVVAL